jgi:hypothetical protein
VAWFQPPRLCSRQACLTAVERQRAPDLLPRGRIGFGFRHPDEAVLLIPTHRHFTGVRAAASRCGSGVRVGDFAQLGKDVSELSHAPSPGMQEATDQRAGAKGPQVVLRQSPRTDLSVSRPDHARRSPPDKACPAGARRQELRGPSSTYATACGQPCPHATAIPQCLDVGPTATDQTVDQLAPSPRNSLRSDRD